MDPVTAIANTAGVALQLALALYNGALPADKATISAEITQIIKDVVTLITDLKSLVGK
jgi:hypothetical protein